MGDHFPQIWKPVVAAVNGWAAGAGFYLLLASTDIRIASDRSRYLLAMTSRGAVGAGPRRNVANAAGALRRRHAHPVDRRGR